MNKKEYNKLKCKQTLKKKKNVKPRVLMVYDNPDGITTGMHYVSPLAKYTKLDIRGEHNPSTVKPGFDLIFMVEHPYYQRKQNIFNIYKGKKAIYWVDNHLNLKEQIKFSKTYKIDFIFVAQKNAVEKFKKEGFKNVFWLPAAVNPTICFPIPLYEMYDFSFVGNIPRDPEDKKCTHHKRLKLLNRLIEDFKMFPMMLGIPSAMRTIYCSAKIGFNSSIKRDLNMRTFEILGCKKMMLVDKQNNLLDLFEDGKHLVTYNNEKDLIKKMKYWSNDDNKKERDKIALAGYKEVMNKHTYEHRVLEILKRCGLMK